MPRGPRGEKRPADTIGCAVMVAKIATGEIEEDLDEVEDPQPQPTYVLWPRVFPKRPTNNLSGKGVEPQ